MPDSLNQSIALIVPTLNAAGVWSSLMNGIRMQTVPVQRVLIIDSSSDDGTEDLARAAGFDVVSIARTEFNHGRTRQLGANLMQDADILVYMTQDAELMSADSIAALIGPFSDPAVGATYGRQIPRPDAGPIERHARSFNYPETSAVRSISDRHHLGIRAAFLSNSFAAYRRSALIAVGGFPEDTIMAEDTLVAARLLMSEWKTVYVAEAQAVHSHPYSIKQEFKRYFDTGVYHTREPWLLETFGTASGEGKRFVLSEIRALWPRHVHLIPSSLLRTLTKYLGYRLGRREAIFHPDIKRKLSLHKGFWDDPEFYS